MYKRSTTYPDGRPIPEVLPESYQSSLYGSTPTGQRCLTCKNFSPDTLYCSAWATKVRPYWWCNGWKPIIKVAKGNFANPSLLKKITTNTVEEHFSETPIPKSKQKDYDFEEYENEEDVIKLNVPLTIRLLEWAREDANKDVDLHVVTERLIELSEEGDILTMSDYPEIVCQYNEEEKKENKS